MTTNDLKNILRLKPLKFILPKELSGLSKTLYVVVYPKRKGNEHDVFVNNVHQRKLYTIDCPLHDMWFRYEKDMNPWYKEFRKDWRYLLHLNLYPEVACETNFLADYYLPKKNRVKLVIHPHQSPEALVCVKDLVTKDVIRLSKGIAEVMVEGKPHLKYCSKREWRHFVNGIKPVKEDFKDNYWKQNDTKEKDEEGKEKDTLAYPFNYIPKILRQVELARPGYFKVINKKVTRVAKPIKKQNIIPTYDRNAKLQTITIEPPVDKDGYIKQIEVKYVKLIPKYVDIPVYGKAPHNKHILFKYKKIFVENIEQNVTFKRDIRTMYKTIITKQYPRELCERRRIIKKNMTLLRQQAEKQKQQEKQIKSE